MSVNLIFLISSFFKFPLDTEEEGKQERGRERKMESGSKEEREGGR